MPELYKSKPVSFTELAIGVNRGVFILAFLNRF